MSCRMQHPVGKQMLCIHIETATVASAVSGAVSLLPCLASRARIATMRVALLSISTTASGKPDAWPFFQFRRRTVVVVCPEPTGSGFSPTQY